MPAETQAIASPVASEILVELTAGLAAGDDLRQLMVRFLEPIMRLAGARAGAVRVLDDHEQLRLVCEIGLPASLQASERVMDAGCGLCGAALSADKPVWAEDLGPCGRRTGDAFFGVGSRRALAVPLHHRGRVLGVCNLFFDDRDEPAADVMSLLKAIGDLLGMALYNTRLEREQLQAAAVAERHAVAADVHDSIGQSLAFVKMRLPLLQDAMRDGDHASAERYFDDVRGAVAQAHTSLRSILAHARTPMDPLGLGHALQSSAEAFRHSAGVSLEYVNDAGTLRLDAQREVQVFHVVQEALTNIARHAHARRAWLRVSARPAGQVRVVVEDDGGGLPLGGASDGAERAYGAHYGLSIMRERAHRLGGTLVVGPREGGGTRVQLDFPLRAESTPELV